MPRPTEWALEVAARDYATRYPQCLSRIMNAFSMIIIDNIWVDTNAVPDDAQVAWHLCGYLVSRDPQHWDTCTCGDAHFGAARRRLGAKDQLHSCVDAGEERYDEDRDRALRRCKHGWIVELLRHAQLIDLARSNTLARQVERDVREVLSGTAALPGEERGEGQGLGGIAA